MLSLIFIVMFQIICWYWNLLNLVILSCYLFKIFVWNYFLMLEAYELGKYFFAFFQMFPPDKNFFKLLKSYGRRETFLSYFILLSVDVDRVPSFYHFDWTQKKYISVSLKFLLCDIQFSFPGIIKFCNELILDFLWL